MYVYIYIYIYIYIYMQFVFWLFSAIQKKIKTKTWKLCQWWTKQVVIQETENISSTETIVINLHQKTILYLRRISLSLKIVATILSSGSVSRNINIPVCGYWSIFTIHRNGVVVRSERGRHKWCLNRWWASRLIRRRAARGCNTIVTGGASVFSADRWRAVAQSQLMEPRVGSQSF